MSLELTLISGEWFDISNKTEYKQLKSQFSREKKYKFKSISKIVILNKNITIGSKADIKINDKVDDVCVLIEKKTFKRWFITVKQPDFKVYISNFESPLKKLVLKSDCKSYKLSRFDTIKIAKTSLRVTKL